MFLLNCAGEGSEERACLEEACASHVYYSFILIILVLVNIVKIP